MAFYVFTSLFGIFAKVLTRSADILFNNRRYTMFDILFKSFAVILSMLVIILLAEVTAVVKQLTMILGGY